MPADIQGEAEQGSEQPDAEENVPALCRGTGLNDLWEVPSDPNHSMSLGLCLLPWSNETVENQHPPAVFATVTSSKL